MNKKFMEIAIKLAKNGINKVYPNPLVGCVIVKDNKIIAKSYHKCFGGHHAEVNAILDAGKNAVGADLYVTLEPCNSYGKQPPCTKAIIDSKIKRVFYAVEDEKKYNSMETLQRAGIKVYGGLLQNQAKKLLSDYLKHEKLVPKLTIKAAVSLDGKIATRTYDSKWITCQKSRDYVHKLRTKYDAILVGTNTALKDNPFLTSHNKGKNPIRVVIDSNLKLKANSNLLNTNYSSTVVLYDKNISVIPKHFIKEGIVLRPIDINKAKKDFSLIIKNLNEISLKTILIEGGGEIITSALSSKIVNDLYLFVAPKIIGGKNAIQFVSGDGVAFVKNALKVKIMKTKKMDKDILIYGRLK